jgi:hypothetical protein
MLRQMPTLPRRLQSIAMYVVGDFQAFGGGTQ